MPTVICQKWEESERGWGTRPDGYSLHRTEEDRTAYIKSYWEDMPNQVPDEYSRPASDPFKTVLSSDSRLYKQLLGCKHGVRIFEWEEKDFLRKESK